MSLQSAMAAAQEASNNLPATQDQSANGNAVAPIAMGTGLDDFLSGGMRPDMWIRVKDTGVWLDRAEKSPVSDEGFEAILDIDSLQFFHGIRAEFAGNNVRYAKSYDGGRTTDKGENFAAVAADFQANGQKYSGTYRGADLILVLENDITQGKTTIPAGTKLGYGTPVTGFYPLQSLLKTLTSQGIISDAGGGRLTGQNVRVKVTHTTETNKSNQDYGVLHFELLGVVND